MKKSLKAISQVILYFGLYFACTFITAIIMSITNHIVYGRSVSSEKMVEILNSQIMLSTGLGALMALAAFYMIFRKKNRNLWEVCLFKKTNGISIVLSLAMAIGLVLISSSFVQLTQNIFPDYAGLSETLFNSSKSITGLLSLIIIIPIFEEVLFRGIAIDALKKGMPMGSAIIVQAIIFAIAHFNMAQGIYAFLIGLIFGLIYIWSGCIWVNILMHMAFNFVGSVGSKYTDKLISQHSIIALILGFIVLGAGLMLFYKKARRPFVDTIIMIDMIKEEETTR